MSDVLDGTSNTLILGEIAWNTAGRNPATACGSRGCNGTASAPSKNIIDPINAIRYTGANFNDVSFGSEHPGGCQFAICDGTVKFVSQDVDMAVYRASASRDGSEPQRIDE